MHLLKQQNQGYFEQMTTQAFSNTKKSTLQFIPFVKERDTMGRLIKKSIHSTFSVQTNQTQSNSPIKHQEKLSIAEGRLEQKMQKYFKNCNIANLVEPTKQKRYKKTIIQLLSEQPKSKDATSQRPSTTASKQSGFTRTFTQSTNLPKTQSLFMPNSPKKDNSTLKRANSTILGNRKSFEKQRQSISPDSASRRNSYNEPKVKIVDNQGKYPQLSRMRRMKQLQVKLHNDFQQKHGQFLNKIIKSKQLAFQVRVALDKIDELC